MVKEHLAGVARQEEQVILLFCFMAGLFGYVSTLIAFRRRCVFGALVHSCRVYSVVQHAADQY